MRLELSLPIQQMNSVRLHMQWLVGPCLVLLLLTMPLWLHSAHNAGAPDADVVALVDEAEAQPLGEIRHLAEALRQRFEVGAAQRAGEVGAVVAAVALADLMAGPSGYDQQRIRAREIDILVDVKGATHGTLMPVTAQRAAPLQVSWLGFPGTTGAIYRQFALTIPSGTRLPVTLRQ